MKLTQTTQHLTEPTETNKQAYETPQVIYEGIITTRAGTPTGNPESGGVDPADLFGK